VEDKKEQPVGEDAMETPSGVPADPEERAFSGHPDHPPASPDQPVEGNQELLRPMEDEEPSDESGD
jgi:hypothetical protein